MLDLCLAVGIAMLGVLRAILNSIMMAILLRLQHNGFTFRITFYWYAMEKLVAMEKRVSELALSSQEAV